MNTTYLLVMLLLTLVAIGAGVWCNKCDSGSASEMLLGVITIFAGIAVAAMLLISFLGSTGADITAETTSFTTEKTPYRVIVKAFGRETTLTDAYSVINADRIERVRLTTARNAWGITHDTSPAPRLTVVFKDAQ